MNERLNDVRMILSTETAGLGVTFAKKTDFTYILSTGVIHT